MHLHKYKTPLFENTPCGGYMHVIKYIKRIWPAQMYTDITM